MVLKVCFTVKRLQAWRVTWLAQGHRVLQSVLQESRCSPARFRCCLSAQDKRAADPAWRAPLLYLTAGWSPQWAEPTVRSKEGVGKPRNLIHTQAKHSLCFKLILPFTCGLIWRQGVFWISLILVKPKRQQKYCICFYTSRWGLTFNWKLKLLAWSPDSFRCLLESQCSPWLASLPFSKWSTGEGFIL